MPSALEAKVFEIPRPPAQHITVKRKAPAQLRQPLGDLENFSFARWLLAKSDEVQTGKPARLNAPYEARWYAKAQNELNGRDGGFLAPEEWRMEFFRVLRGGLILNKLEVNIATSKARVSHLPWGITDWTFNYLGDNAPATSTDRGFSQSTFTFRKAVALGTSSRELIQDSGDLADKWLKDDAGSAMAHEIDKQALFGSGNSGAPVGLVNQSFVNSLTLFNDSGNGATPIYNDITNGIASVAVLGNTTLISGGAAECNGAIAAPRFGQTLDNIQSPAGIPIWQYGLSNEQDMPSQPRWLGIKNWVLSALVPAGLTKGTSGDCSYLVFGDWRYFYLLIREDFQFSMEPAPGFQNNQMLIKIIARYDAQALFPFAFAFYTGVRL